DGPGRYPGPAQRLHRLALGALASPALDQGVHLGAVVPAVAAGREARVVQQVVAADDPQEPLPVVVAGAGGVDVAVVVGAVALAAVDLAGGAGAQHALVADARGRAVPERLAGVGDAAEVDDRLLHRHLDPPAASGALA